MFKTIVLSFVPFLLASGAGPVKCTVFPVQWTVNNVYVDGVTPSLITNDGNAAYVDGQSGVSAQVSNCGSEDALIALSGTSRVIYLNFTEPLYSDQYAPSTLIGSKVSAASVNVRNIFFNYNATAEYTFTTRLGANVLNLGPLRMVNLYSQAVPPGSGNDDAANSPIPDALVYVHHCPKSAMALGGCPVLSHETWFVYPDQTKFGPSPYYPTFTIAQTGTLLLTVGNGKNATTVNAGEFAMPFYFAISLLN